MLTIASGCAMLRVQDVQHSRQANGESVRILHSPAWCLLSLQGTYRRRESGLRSELSLQWIALQNNADGTGPLASYFQGEQLNTGKADTFTANM
jgi:hypothetical protein